MTTHQKLARQVVGRHGTTYAQDAGITLKDTPSPLYRLLVLSARISGHRRRGGPGTVHCRLPHPPTDAGRDLAAAGGRAGTGPIPALRRTHGHDAR